MRKILIVLLISLALPVISVPFQDDDFITTVLALLWAVSVVYAFILSVKLIISRLRKNPIEKPVAKSTAPTEPVKTEPKRALASFGVAGTSFRQKALKDYMEADGPSDQWSMSRKKLEDEFLIDDTVWKYEPAYPKIVRFVDEPENKYDSNAIAIYAGDSEDSLFQVGYVPADRIDQVKRVRDKAKRIELVILGGPSKWYNGDEEKFETENGDYSARVKVY